MFGFQRQECTHTHTQHNTLSGGIYRELQSPKKWNVTACVCVQNTHREAILNCGTDDIGCDKGKKREKKLAGREKDRNIKLFSLSESPKILSFLT